MFCTGPTIVPLDKFSCTSNSDDSDIGDRAVPLDIFTVPLDMFTDDVSSIGRRAVPLHVFSFFSEDSPIGARAVPLDRCTGDAPPPFANVVAFVGLTVFFFKEEHFTMFLKPCLNLEFKPAYNMGFKALLKYAM